LPNRTVLAPVARLTCTVTEPIVSQPPVLGVATVTAMPPNSVRNAFGVALVERRSVRALTQAAMPVTTASACALPASRYWSSRPAMILWMV
jgi:hypothetical protein